MGLDLGNILSTMGTVYVGDPYSLEPGYSIGGVTSDVGIILNNLLGLLGTISHPVPSFHSRRISLR